MPDTELETSTWIKLDLLVARMKAKRYKPQPAKRVYIPKDEHSQRPLGLPALEDKIVQVGIPSGSSSGGWSGICVPCPLK